MRAGALKTLGANKDAPLPVKLFEASDVILLDAAAETGARNERRLVAVACAKEGSFEVIHGLLNRVMDVLGVPLLGGCTLFSSCHGPFPALVAKVGSVQLQVRAFDESAIVHAYSCNS